MKGLAFGALAVTLVIAATALVWSDDGTREAFLESELYKDLMRRPLS